MPFKIIRNDITKVKADAIVNTANPEPIYAAGTDAAIYEAAGADLLLAERKKIGAIARGHAAVTPAFALSAQYIIHTVGPSWEDGNHGEFDVLTACYENSLALAAKLDCKSIAFPLIATGVYGFPKDKALQIAVSVISRFLLSSDMQVILVVFDRQAFALSGKLFSDVDAFIDENYVAARRKREYGDLDEYALSRAERMRRRERESLGVLRKMEEASVASPPVKPMGKSVSSISIDAATPFSLDDAMADIGDTFQEKLLALIDERGLEDTDVYKKANIDRKLFSKIRCNPAYKPKKKTALALAIALELNLEETMDLLGRAELAFSPSNKTDVIIRYFISRQEYDMYNINLALFQHHQPTLGV